MKELRGYQQKTVNDVMSSDKDIIICLPTGAGKTVIASELIQRIEDTVVFVVPRLELIEQAKNEFEFPTDLIWSDKTNIEGNHCIIASKDSLRRRYTELSGDIVLIFDEAHIGIEQTYNLVNAIKPKRVLGLTATPERMDGFALLKGSDSIHKFGVFDELLKAETVPSLIKKGYLCNLKYYAKPIEGITNIRPDNSTGEELSGSQMTQIFNENGIWGDLVQTYEQYGLGRPAIGFTTTIDMAEKVVGVFTDAGYNFKVISGEMSVKTRQELIRGLESGEIDGLVNAALLTYGFDCPVVSYAFNCRHVKSRPLWFQMVGRVLRLSEGKTDAIFVDHGDSISEFSEPNCPLPIMDELIQWRADGESKEEKQARKKALKKVQETMKIIQELDPLPAEMVEITMEDTYERLIRIINNLLKENKTLLLQNNRLGEINNKLENTIDSIQAENDQLRDEVRNKQKVISKDDTFEYVRRNYCATRRWIEGNWERYYEKEYIDRIKAAHNDSGEGFTPLVAHLLTVNRLKSNEDRLSFYFDDITFRNSCNYWQEHYKKDY